MKEDEQAWANRRFADGVAEYLAEAGVRTVVISPGSRSTPLVLGFASLGSFRLIPVLDERSAAFLALGLARSTERPVGLVCTSGSAVANWFPAVVEAHESRVPLLLMTADRPPELRGCGAGQTIDQERFYGRYTRAFREYPIPGDEDEGKVPWRDFLAADWAALSGDYPGPVHLNFPFREPLLPPESESFPSPKTFFGKKVSGSRYGRPFDAPVLPSRWQEGGRTLLLSGSWLGPGGDDWTGWFRNLAGERGWPLLADALSPLRHQEEGSFRPVAHYDMLLRHEEIAKTLRPDRIIQLGSLPTSKVLRKCLEEWQTPRLIIDPYSLNPHPDTAPVEWLARPDKTSNEIPLPPPGEDSGFRENWVVQDKKAGEFIQAKTGESGSFEGALYPLLAEHLPEQTVLHIASSTPVRDAEWFWPVNGKRFRIYSSRGANGIDGTLSTAIGEAVGEARPLWLVTGDLALLHDANGILQHQLEGLSLTILLINNEGGGIFQNLPIARYGETFERFFATPQQIDWGTWAKTFGVSHALVRDPAELAQLAARPAPAGVRILEWATDRRGDAEERRRWLTAFSP
ncbi:MAG: 2-succinyl-5-enolpyruvyl-6-hydroxy-3-cyclohexene-1-carboxylic-acid synthase [Opitutales bacterium]|nr:2-succinyl-5-enolpyruvyl-6-hydroxy-3-cyclohexene-1-carboxylic-acid synthase [Opitutales bacterium]